MATPEFDASRARLDDPDLFDRFVVKKPGVPVASCDLDERAGLLVIEREGERLAFSEKQMAYHHLAQGTLRGTPYLVSF